MPKFIISDYRKGTRVTWYVCAPPGYYRKANGTLAKDGCFQGGPEWSTTREHALEFHSHRSAARVANKCVSATIKPV